MALQRSTSFTRFLTSYFSRYFIFFLFSFALVFSFPSICVLSDHGDILHNTCFRNSISFLVNQRVNTRWHSCSYDWTENEREKENKNIKKSEMKKKREIVKRWTSWFGPKLSEMETNEHRVLTNSNEEPATNEKVPNFFRLKYRKRREKLMAR